MSTGLLHLVVLICLSGAAFAERIFFPGSGFPKLQRGVMEIDGYYADTSKIPAIVTNDEVTPQEERPGYSDTQSRRLSQSLPDAQDEDVRSRFLISSVASDGQVVASSPFLNPFRVTDTVTVTNVQTPLCIACKCLTTAQTCAQARGYQLVSITIRTATFPVTPTNALVCSPAIGGTGTPATGTTITCLFNPPTTLSVCDPSCISAPPGSTCRTTPTTTNCGPVNPLPEVCSTDCKNLTAVGSAVKCNSVYSNTISARPTTVCAVGVQKREVSSSPAIESSFETGPETRTGRFFGFQIYRTTVTKVTSVTGIVTATYVPSASCLPTNLITAPSC